MDIGLVLSGGMAKGAYQIGALKAISNFVPINEIKYMSCASIGTLNGYAFAVDKLIQAEQMWKNLCKDQENNRLFITSILKGTLLQRNIKELCCETDKLSSQFYTALFDIRHREIVYKELSDVDPSEHQQYLKASVAMPAYNRAIGINGRFFFDGAIVDNIPVLPILKHKLDYIICVYFDDVCYKFENIYFDNKIIKITFPCKNIVQQSLAFSQNNIEQMITDGYWRTVDILSFILKNGIWNNCDKWMISFIKRYIH